MADRTQQKLDQAIYETSRVFTPSAPIDEQALFAGRTKELRQVIDAINQRGQHAIIYGERGAGKTSLANVLSPWLQSLGQRVLAPRINCDGSDTFATVWRKMLAELQSTRELRRSGFTSETEQERFNAADAIASDPVTPDQIRRVLKPLGDQGILVVVFDEFDRLSDRSIQRLFADTIKTLSDHSVRVTVVLLGAADTVDQLIEEHHSIERALVQIQLKRMSSAELRVIIENGIARLGMTADDEAIDEIVTLSRGLPHYTHLLGLYACRAAIDARKMHLAMTDVQVAIANAVTRAQQTIRDTYHKATMSQRRDNLYADVLLACAMTGGDDLGYFSAADVREPLQRITGKSYDIPNFSQHLKNFCDTQRGPILQRTGVERRFRFRFGNPLVQPFVVLKGYSDGKISRRKWH